MFGGGGNLREGEEWPKSLEEQDKEERSPHPLDPQGIVVSPSVHTAAAAAADTEAVVVEGTEAVGGKRGEGRHQGGEEGGRGEGQ